MSDTDAARNIQIVREMMAGAGLEPVMAKHLAEDVVLSVAPGMPYGGDYPGLDGYRRIVGALMGAWSEISFGEAEFAAVGNKVVAISRLKGTLPSGKVVDEPFCEIWEIRNGKIAQVTPFYYDTKNIADG
jgi:ketosteroid isomerase-like protein